MSFEGNAYACWTYVYAMMWIQLWLMRLLVGAFLIGLAGSAIVVVISFIEDFGVLLNLHRDD